MTSLKESPDNQIITDMIERARIQGYILVEDLIEVCSGEESNEELTKKVMHKLISEGVELVEQGETEEELDSDEDNHHLRANDLDQHSAADTVGLYLKEMSRVPLLTFKDEISLAKRIKEGKEAEYQLMCNESLLSNDDILELEDICRDGELAWEHLIKANTRLVVSVAKKYSGQSVPLLDLIQEGNLGLIRAVEKYDHTRGFRFSTYATWWIRQAISRSIADQSRTIRIPVHMSDRLRKLYKISHNLEQELSRKPTIEEIAECLDLPPKKVAWMIKISWLPLSLETPSGDEDESTLEMFVEDETSPSPLEITSKEILIEKLDEVLMTLPIREARVLRMRFGLGIPKAYTLEEIGKKFGLTRERIRQIEGKALRRLRNPKRSSILRELV
ncbi:MAG: sigma-70 family RNA polymerase sigma factor [Anaerolineaceae bacterium]|nr:sigma-70 family RNA polymerase sigma factor [Anaerolineaceae bacterium]